jgi:hypothetical protein
LEGRKILNKIKITGCYKLEAKMCLTFRRTDCVNLTIPPDKSKSWEESDREKNKTYITKGNLNEGNRRETQKCKKKNFMTMNETEARKNKLTNSRTYSYSVLKIRIK